MEQKNLWESVGNLCLLRAECLLKSETAPTAATVETVRTLVRTAIEIDKLNLLWEVQSQCGVRVSPDQLFSLRATEN